MAIGVFCGVVPFIFRRRPSSFKEEETHKSRRLLRSRVIRKIPSMLVPKRTKSAAKGSNNVRDSYGVSTPNSPRLPKSKNKVKTNNRNSTISNSYGVASNFRIMTGIRDKILTLRDLLDLTPCDGSESANELLISTLSDLHKLYPSINPEFDLSKIDGSAIHEKVRCFCEALKSIGEMWTGNDEWMITWKEKSQHSKLSDFEHVLALLDDVIKVASGRMLEMTEVDEDEDEEEEEEEVHTADEDGRTRDRSPSPVAFEQEFSFSDSYSSNNSSLSSSPTSILPSELVINGSKTNTKPSIPSPLLVSLRVQAVGKLNPIEVNHLSFHVFPNNVTQDSNYSNEQNSKNIEGKQHFEFSQPCEIKDLPEILLNNLESVSENGGLYWTGVSNGQPVPARVTFNVLIPPSSIYKMQSNFTEQSTAPPSPYILSPKSEEPQISTPPPPDSSLSSENEESTPSSPRAQHITSENKLTPPPPPPPPLAKSKNGSVPPPPLPPPIPSKNKAAPQPPSPPPIPSKNQAAPQQPSPPPIPSKNQAAPQPPSPPPILSKKQAAPQPPSPPPISSKNRKVPTPPLPPHMTSEQVQSPKRHKGLNGTVSPAQVPQMIPNVPVPAPPPPMPIGKGVAPPPPLSKGGAPPPPPPSGKNIRMKKAATKLKRSSHMGNLYRNLKGKVEGGNNVDGKSKGGGKGKFNAAAAPKGDKLGMADALAEMTKRSAYFQQIEEDVKNHAKTILEVKKAIATFETSDMSELLRFHKYVESHLEKLTDESQVLARFEDFPSKKLEGLRLAGALFSKLDSIACTLQNWPMDGPTIQILNRAERYFNKIKGDLDTLERTKDDEAKKLKTHKINFDFGVLVRIKELMVDVSSNCMELALKEKRQGGGSKKETSELLWKAFQFAFRVYTFAGGQDERAEKLTKELAEEIETDLHP